MQMQWVRLEVKDVRKNALFSCLKATETTGSVFYGGSTFIHIQSFINMFSESGIFTQI